MSEETLKTENNLKIIQIIFKKNIKYILILTFVIILAAIASIYVKNNKEKNQVLVSEKFINAKILLEKKQNGKAKKILEELVDNKNSFYSPLSLSLIISNELEKSEENIINLFDKVLSINSLEKLELDLVLYKKTIFLAKIGKEQKLLDTANRLINNESSLRNETINLLGEYFLNKGEKSKSEEYFNLLKNKN
jgi:predicted negative regulator of RcsB-dependent stress response